MGLGGTTMTARTILNFFVAVSRRNNTSRDDHLGKGFVKKRGTLSNRHSTINFLSTQLTLFSNRRITLSQDGDVIFRGHGQATAIRKDHIWKRKANKNISPASVFFFLFKNRVPKKGYFPHKIDQTAKILRLKKFIKNTGRGKANSIDILCAIFSGLKN